jgi:sRNA-binding protein
MNAEPPAPAGAGGATSSAERRAKPTPPSPNPQQDHDKALEAELRERWPKVFSESDPRPLAIGVHMWIARRLGVGDHNKRLRRVLDAWCSRGVYLEAMAEPGARRFDLSGLPAGPVSDKHQQHARERLAALGANHRRPTLRLGRAP